MSILSIQLRPEELRSLAAGSVGASYTNLGDPLSNAAVIFHLQNNTNDDILVSFFDDEDHEFVGVGSFLLIDVAANRSNTGSSRVIPAKTQVKVKHTGSAPSTGTVYLATFYAFGGD